MAIVLLGTLDTKGEELRFVREWLQGQGFTTLVIDAGSAGPPSFDPDIGREEVFQRAGTTWEAVRDQGERGEAVRKAAIGCAQVVADLATAGRVEGVLGIGGSAGTIIATTSMRRLPLGLPKVMISTLASGQTRPFLGGSDIVMVPTIADIAGLNRLTRAALALGANALAGMVRGPTTASEYDPDSRRRPLIAASMFGVTTPCVDRARRNLECAGTRSSSSTPRESAASRWRRLFVTARFRGCST